MGIPVVFKIARELSDARHSMDWLYSMQAVAPNPDIGCSGPMDGIRCTKVR
jgi:hypothetical protein